MILPEVHLTPPLNIDPNLLLTLPASASSGYWAGPRQRGIGVAQGFGQGGRKGGSEPEEALTAPGQIKKVPTRDGDSFR